MTRDIRSLDRNEIAAAFQRWNQPAYRVDQLLEWLYTRRAADWTAMSNLPKALRDQLAADYTCHSLELIQMQGSHDTTQKFLWRLPDHALIESVLIPANPSLYGEPSDRHTLCVSTQVGCAYGCRFCASGLDGWKRNLQVDEIVGQILAVERWHEASLARSKALPVTPSLPSDGGVGRGEERAVLVPPAAGRLINNLVIMGMGEPLANYDNLLKALRILNAPWGGNIGARKITLSTSGLAPQIRKLADEPEQFRLALSLHGATDAVRTQIMPINKKYPLKELTAACEYYQRKKGGIMTFEYILIEGVNDRLDQTKPLAQLARRLRAKVNLIPYNRVEGLAWKRPAEPVQEAFLAALEQLGTLATLRREKGHDIDAACGQLRLKTERALTTTPSPEAAAKG